MLHTLVNFDPSVYSCTAMRKMKQHSQCTRLAATLIWPQWTNRAEEHVCVQIQIALRRSNLHTPGG
jgi:alanine-alpha-ketoisovalerate/valine-pyruvate aminotransferase